MFEAVRDEVFALLEITDAEVTKVRERVAEEAQGGAARTAREHQLEHPDGFSTPLNEAVRRAETKASKLRAKADALAKPYAVAALAADAAEAGLSRLRRANDDKLAMKAKRDVSGMHADAEEFIAKLHRHGICHWDFKQMRSVEVAIIADLIWWKVDSPRHQESASPWRRVLEIYAGRALHLPGTWERSKPEKPPPKPDPKHFWKPWPYFDTAGIFAKLFGSVIATEPLAPSVDAPQTAQRLNDIRPMSAPAPAPAVGTGRTMPVGEGKPRSKIAELLAQKHAAKLESRSANLKGKSDGDK